MISPDDPLIRAAMLKRNNRRLLIGVLVVIAVLGAANLIIASGAMQ